MAAPFALAAPGSSPTAPNVGRDARGPRCDTHEPREGRGSPALTDEPDRPVAIVFYVVARPACRRARCTATASSFITRTDVGDTWAAAGACRYTDGAPVGDGCLATCGAA
jgi:hypothetical protein